ncbi:MAG: LysR family transcriptional regulator [Shimia sp.]|nr:LysR family transcriptional regulator [Shimia sp.]
MLTETSLEAFCQLAKTNSFQEADRRMGVSNASLTRYIAQAEEEAGVALFLRSRNNCKMTRAGQQFFPLAQQLEQDLRRFSRQVDILREGGGRQLRVACGPLVPRALVAPVTQAVLQALPDMRLHLEVNARMAPLEKVLSGEMDIFIGDLTHTPEAEGVEILVMEKRQVVFVAHPDHPVHAHGTCSLADVLQFPLASGHLHKHWRATFTKLLGGDQAAADRVSLLPQIESDDYHFLTGLARDGQFVVGAVEETFEEPLALGWFKRIPLKAPITWNICAVRKRGVSSPALEAFWRELSIYAVNPVAA